MVIQVVQKKDGEERQTYKKSNELVFIQDPENPGMMFPITVSKIVKQLDDSGAAFGSASQIVEGRCGCIVNSSSIVECHRCRRKVCKRHSFPVKDVYFCRKFPCGFMGRLHQIFRIVYRVIRYCFRSVTGLGE